MVVLWPELAILGVAFLLGDVVVAGMHARGRCDFPFSVIACDCRICTNEADIWCFAQALTNLNSVVVSSLPYPVLNKFFAQKMLGTGLRKCSQVGRGSQKSRLAASCMHLEASLLTQRKGDWSTMMLIDVPYCIIRQYRNTGSMKSDDRVSGHEPC